MSESPISPSGIETDTSSITSKTSTLQDMAVSPFMLGTHKDILQIIRKEEDHAMALLAKSPLLSCLFLTYANRAATLDAPPAPSPADQEWMEMKALNNRLQGEIALLKDQSTKEADRAREAEGYVEALRAQLSSFKETNNNLEAAVAEERAKAKEVASEYADYKKGTTDTIAELRSAVDKEAGARTALSQIIAEQQATLASLKGKSESPLPSPPPPVFPPQPQDSGRGFQSWRRSTASTSDRGDEAPRQIDTRGPRDGSERSFKSTRQQDDPMWKDSTENARAGDKNRKDGFGDSNNNIKPRGGGKQGEEKTDWDAPKGVSSWA